MPFTVPYSSITTATVFLLFWKLNSCVLKGVFSGVKYASSNESIKLSIDLSSFDKKEVIPYKSMIPLSSSRDSSKTGKKSFWLFWRLISIFSIGSLISIPKISLLWVITSSTEILSNSRILKSMSWYFLGINSPEFSRTLFNSSVDKSSLSVVSFVPNNFMKKLVK